MSLINCKECGKEISSEANVCPNCGCPLKEITRANVDSSKSDLRKTGTILSIINSTVFIVGLIILQSAQTQIEEVIISFIIIILGMLYLKEKFNRKYIIIYGIILFILSIFLTYKLITNNQFFCIQFLSINSIGCFIGSILILIGNIKNED